MTRQRCEACNQLLPVVDPPVANPVLGLIPAKDERHVQRLTAAMDELEIDHNWSRRKTAQVLRDNGVTFKETALVSAMAYRRSPQALRVRSTWECMTDWINDNPGITTAELVKCVVNGYGYDQETIENFLVEKQRDGTLYLDDDGWYFS